MVEVIIETPDGAIYQEYKDEFELTHERQEYYDNLTSDSE